MGAILRECHTKLGQLFLNLVVALDILIHFQRLLTVELNRHTYSPAFSSAACSLGDSSIVIISSSITFLSSAPPELQKGMRLQAWKYLLQECVCCTAFSMLSPILNLLA